LIGIQDDLLFLASDKEFSTLLVWVMSSVEFNLILWNYKAIIGAKCDVS
jgi:hypothetical protein